MSKETTKAAIPTSERVKLSFQKPKSKLAMINNASGRYDTVDDEFSEFETIRSTLKRIQDSNSTIATGTKGDTIPILHISKASASDLCKVLSLFVSEVPKSATRKEMTEKLSRFIPTVMIQAPPTKPVDGKLCAGCSSKPHWFSKKSGACSWCNRQFCKKCPLEVHHYPRIGLASCALCTDCVENFTREDANDWADASIKFLARPNDELIVASLGCAFIAMALGANSQDLLRKIAKELHVNGIHTLAYNILSLTISQSDGYTTNEMKLHFLASSILKSLAQDRSKSWEEKWSFALASKEAYVTALDIGIAIENDVEIPDDKRKGLGEVENLLRQLLEDNKGEHKRVTLQHTRRLEALWQERPRDIPKMLNFLREIATDYSDVSAATMESASLEAFKSFLQNKEPFLSSMLHEDKQALVFLTGVLKLKEEKMVSALADFESVAWNSSQSGISKENILSAYLYILSNHNGAKVYSYEALKHTFQSGSKTLLFSKPAHSLLEERSISLLFPSDEELTPPFKANWPSLSVVDHNTRCHQKYEEAVLKFYDEKKWSNMKVACAYMDEFAGCEHPAEMVVCYLHSAMWMARNFGPKSKIDPSVLFGYKAVLLLICYAITLKYLNPGMELYVNRLILGIVRKIALVPGSKVMFTDEDSVFLRELLKRQLKVSRMFPFWEPPSVSVSEAVLLNIVTRNLHSNFILELQFLNSEHRPLTDLELNYQLYENDLRSILPLENSSDTRARAMEEILKPQGWSFNDVMQTMSSSLCPRDKEGWIIQTPHLGVTQQYFDITGFVVDTDPQHPSIKLLVVEANPRMGRVGLFSQEDINTMLQLDLDDLPLFFSLDPPSQDLDKIYHPFQQWRYGTEKVKDTEVLNTMFITDYLMKSFTVGSDVSSLPPFKQRPCRNGLTKNLPPELQKAIRSIHERGGVHSSSHRFWIETKEIKFDCQQHELRVEFRFGEMEMEVKSHSLFRKADGSETDTDEDDDPESPHATFARDMTENYSMLGEYFPVFMRLQRLGKLQLFSLMLQSLLQSIKDQSQGKGIDIPKEKVRKIQEDVRRQHHTNVSTGLIEMKQEVGVWPKAEDHSIIRSKVDEIKRAIREEIRQGEERLHRIHGYNITIDNSDALRTLDHVESQVIEAMRTNDENALTQITSALRSSVKMPDDYRLKQCVRNWLSSSGYNQTPRENLVKYLCSYLPVPTYDEIYKSIVSYHQERYQALLHLIEPFKRPHKPRNSCKWVPAAISPRSLSISYGGVAFNIKAVPIRDGERLPHPRNETMVSIQRRSTVAPQTGHVNYSAPRRNAEGKSSQGSSGGANSWNDTGSDSSGNKGSSSSSSGSARFPREAAAAASSDNQRRHNSSKLSQTAEQTKTLGDIAKGSSSSARPAVTASSFKENRAPGVNDQVDKFRHGVNTDNSRASSSAKPPTGGGGGVKGGGGEGGGGGKGNNNFITGCQGRAGYCGACRSPASVVNPKAFEGLPLSGSGGIKSSGDRINGLYVLKNRETGQVYVGRSVDVFQRMGQHQTDIRNGRKTVGSFISSMDQVDFAVLELPSDLSPTEMRFYEQRLLKSVKALYGNKVMNVINAMKEETYNQLSN